MSNAVKTVSQYVFAMVPDMVNHRVVNSAILLPTMPPVPKAIVGKDLIFAMIARPFTRAELAERLLVSRPETLPAWAERNVKVTLSANPQSGLLGTLDIWYERLALNFVLKPSLKIPLKNAKTIHDLIPALTEATGVAFAPEDLMDDEIPVHDQQLTLRAGPFSYFWVPGSTAKITFGERQLSDVIKVHNLQGFVPPDAPLGKTA